MASKRQQNSIAMADRMDAVSRQFKNLDAKNPYLWPIFPKALLCLAVALVVAFVAWIAFLKDYEVELDEARSTEITLRDGYRQKLIKAVNLDVLKKQREQIKQYVLQLEKQLPSKAEMAALLSDISQVGLGRSLQFELFKPGQVVAKNYYAELPIAIRVSGKYHDIGAFAADVAHLSRIVTLNNISIAPAGTRGANILTMDATARTFRYLDPEEIQAQKKAGGAK